MTKRSPLAPARFPDIPEVPGVRLAALESGMRYTGRSDLMLAELAPGSAVAGTFTTSRTAAAPVDWCRRALAASGGRGRAIVVNAGNANAFTGQAGVEAVDETAAAAAEAVGCRPDEVLLASTGVIGEPMPPGHIPRALPALRAKLGPGNWADAAAAITTTDTFPKGAVRTARVAGRTVTLAGFAKGSGMIAPDMATMLAFLFTDAAIAPDVLQRLLGRAVARSFNCITVDGDTSTSDTVILAATGRAAGAAEATDGRGLGDFRRQLEDLAADLAQQIARDGEGAEKFVTIRVAGAASARAARRIGLAIGNSPLVKTAIAGADANWGRIVMAVGKAGEKADRDKLRIAVGGEVITEFGRRRADYDESPVAAHMRGRDILIEVDVGVGRGRATVWTCDLTHGYIDINADYRS